jgi:hypothetical protein
MGFGDTLPRAAFGGVEFPYTRFSVRGSARLVAHAFLLRPGVECNERRSDSFVTGVMRARRFEPELRQLLVALCDVQRAHEPVTFGGVSIDEIWMQVNRKWLRLHKGSEERQIEQCGEKEQDTVRHRNSPAVDTDIHNVTFLAVVNFRLSTVALLVL